MLLSAKGIYQSNTNKVRICGFEAGSDLEALVLWPLPPECFVYSVSTGLIIFNGAASSS